MMFCRIFCWWNGGIAIFHLTHQTMEVAYFIPIFQIMLIEVKLLAIIITVDTFLGEYGIGR